MDFLYAPEGFCWVLLGAEGAEGLVTARAKALESSGARIALLVSVGPAGPQSPQNLMAQGVPVLSQLNTPLLL